MYIKKGRETARSQVEVLGARELDRLLPYSHTRVYRKTRLSSLTVPLYFRHIETIAEEWFVRGVEVHLDSTMLVEVGSDAWDPVQYPGL